MPRRRALLGLALSLLAASSLLVGCSSDDDGDATAEATSTPTATETATSTATMTETSTPTETATAAAPFGLTAEDVDGLVCTGQWQNETFGSSGAFAATIEVGGDGGQITLDLGGNVFGASGGTIEMPYALRDGAVVVSAPLGFLGVAELRLDGATNQGTFSGPPALGDSAAVTMVDFAFDAETLSAAFDIDFGAGQAPAHSVINADCARP
ncbi:MAG: hypothetical protein R3C39_04205 [Dehalococcoidia bacterium]